MGVLILQKKRFTKLTEVCMYTEQLAEAVDRKDAVSIHMLLSMRQEPLLHLGEFSEKLEKELLRLCEDDAIRIAQLIDGATPQTPQEKLLTDQVASNQRLSARILELDKRINLKTCGTSSFYHKHS